MSYTPTNVRLVDLGTVTAVAAATGGPKLLYTPATGERIYGPMVASVTFTDSGFIVVASLAQLAANMNLAQGGLAGFDTDLSAGVYGAPDLTNQKPAGSGTNSSGWWFVTDALYAGFYTNLSNALVDSAPGVWQALHDYTLGQWIIDGANHLQHVTTAGTSGAIIPAFDDSGGTTPDGIGTLVWTDEGLVPTVGQMDVVVHVATL